MALVLRPDADSPGGQKVMHGDWQVGQIDRRPVFTGTEPRWLWALKGVAGTLDKAEAEVRKRWEQWLAWAGLSDVEARF